jgi:formate hydrogenlyase transcriptional activator
MTFDSMLTVVSAALGNIVPHDHIGITLFDPASRTMRLEAWMLAGSRPVTNDARRLPIDRSLEGIVFQRNAPVLFSGNEVRAFGKAGAPVLSAVAIETACGLPLVTSRRAVGVLTVGSHQPEAFSAGDVDLLKQVAGQLAIGVENAIAYGELAGDRDALAGQKRYLEEEIGLHQEFGDIIGRSPAMRHVLQLVQSVAPTDATVLLLGETGTGKELLARAVHNLSPRRPHTFVKLNSAALPDQLFESELFGYEKGAFTGAVSSKAGRLELAHRGSIFLDEIGDLPVDLQVKLLRVLQEQEFERLGSHRTIQVDVRLIAATNRDLRRLVDEGQFRSDLY